jgi:hypothetical protein
MAIVNRTANAKSSLEPNLAWPSASLTRLGCHLLRDLSWTTAWWRFGFCLSCCTFSHSGGRDGWIWHHSWWPYCFYVVCTSTPESCWSNEPYSWLGDSWFGNVSVERSGCQSTWARFGEVFASCPANTHVFKSHQSVTSSNKMIGVSMIEQATSGSAKKIPPWCDQHWSRQVAIWKEHFFKRASIVISKIVTKYQRKGRAITSKVSRIRQGVVEAVFFWNEEGGGIEDCSRMIILIQTTCPRVFHDYRYVVLQYSNSHDLTVNSQLLPLVSIMPSTTDGRRVGNGFTLHIDRTENC